MHSGHRLGLLMAIMGASNLCAAQEVTASGPVVTEGLQEIVVTAQRREENLQHAAVAVTALTGDQLQGSGTLHQQDLTQLVPALQVATAAGPYPLFYLRGVGNFNGNAFSDSAVAVNVDGIYISRPSSTAGLFYDLSRVEVLKGPQGTLYGRNATGGAVNVITNKPTADFGGEGTIDIGNHGTKNFSGEVHGALTSTLDARLAVQSTQHDGYMSDGTDDDRGRAGRLQFKFTPNDTLTLNTSATTIIRAAEVPAPRCCGRVWATWTAIREPATPPPPLVRFMNLRCIFPPATPSGRCSTRRLRLAHCLRICTSRTSIGG